MCVGAHVWKPADVEHPSLLLCDGNQEDATVGQIGTTRWLLLVATFSENGAERTGNILFFLGCVALATGAH